MNRLVFGTLFLVGLAALVSMTYAAVMIDDRETRLFMALGGVLGLIVTGFSAFAFFQPDPEVEQPAKDLNTQPLDPERTDLRLMRWPGWAWLLTVITATIVAMGYLVLGVGVDVSEESGARRLIAVPLAAGAYALWWLGRKGLQACGVRFFRVPCESPSEPD